MLEFTSIRAFYEFVQAPPPPDDDFAVRRLEDAQRLINKVSAPAFRHCFYVVALHLTGNIAYHAGSVQRYLDGPFVFFSRPYQLTSWELPTDAILNGFHLMFAESFLRRYPALAGLVGQLPFLQVGKAIPFAIEPADVIRLTSLYQQITEECYGGKPDRFDLIATYLQTLLFQVRRLYDKVAASGAEPAKLGAGFADETLVGRFRALLERTLHQEGAPRYRTATHYAQELGVPVRALDEAIRRVTGRSAHAMLHDHLLLTAKALLVQTTLSIKEIAYHLDFNEPAHFTNFFKKYTRQTPAQFREQEHA